MNDVMDHDTDDETRSLSQVAKVLDIILFVSWIVGWIVLAAIALSGLLLILDASGLSTLQDYWEDGGGKPHATGMLIGVSFLGCAVALFIIHQLRKFSRTLVTGDPFVPENASRLRRIWVALVSFEVVRIILAIAIKTLMDPSDLSREDLTLDMRLFVWFLILVLAVLAEVFRVGARLREDQQLTI